jgi:hypothetical protein
MGRLREIPRTAAFAWSAGNAKPAIVTGTRAGAVDADFTSENKLEIWDLDLDNREPNLDLKPVASLDTEFRYLRPCILLLDRLAKTLPDSTTLHGVNLQQTILKA